MFSKSFFDSMNQNNKKRHLSKSISLIISTSNIPSTNISKRLQQKHETNKSNSINKSSNRNLKLNKNKKTSKISNFTMHKHNSQQNFYSKKNILNESQVIKDKISYQKSKNYVISESNTPKLIDIINSKIKEKKHYVDTYNYTNKGNSCIKTKASLSSYHKKKNLSQSDFLNLGDFCIYDIFKGSRNPKLIKQKEQEKDILQINLNNITNKNKYLRYDKNKCIIERKIYDKEEIKRKEKKDEKKVVNRTLPNNYQKNKNLIFNNIKLDNLNNILNIKITDNKNNQDFIKPNSKYDVINTSMEEDFIENNENDINLPKNMDIKLMLPTNTYKSDIYNESSQASTNQVNSNKYTLNNNIGDRKEKFISSFLDGPEDIHCRFVELHKQRKMFYENLCNNIDGVKSDFDKNIMTDFEKCEYSEYFENYDKVPLI